MEQKPSLDVKLTKRRLPDEVKRNREVVKEANARIEKIARPRMLAQIRACTTVLEQLKSWHQQIADETDLDLTGYSRGSALWLVSGRSLGLLQTLIVLAEGGIEAEALVVGRALHEANAMLLAFAVVDEEDLVRTWLDDEGKYSWVRPSASHKAQARFEEKIEAALRDQGRESNIPRTAPLTDELYDRLSRTAHSRRSSCVASTSEPLRQFSYGRHQSPLRRAEAVEWLSAVTGDVLNSVGDALRSFYGEDFFVTRIAPLIASVLSVRIDNPLDTQVLLDAADGER